MVAPAGTDPDRVFGRGISFHELVMGLRRINPLITAWNWHGDTPERPDAQRNITCLWLGPANEARSVKITGVSAGVVPEFTQIFPAGHAREGEIEMKGWRAIFDRVIKAKAATRFQLEREFRVSLDATPELDQNCPMCNKLGIRKRAISPGGLCINHDHLAKLCQKGRTTP